MHLFAFIIGILSKKNIFAIFFVIYLWVFDRKKIMEHLIFFCFGLSIFLVHEQVFSSLPDLFSKPRAYQGKILSFRQVYPNWDKYLVELEGSKLKTWLFIKHQNREMYPGEVYAWHGQWRPLQDYYNPGRENIWYQSFQHHIFGSCFSFISPKKMQTISSWDLLNRSRVKLYHLAQLHLTNDFSRAIFLTLILGVSSEMEQADWTLFKNTGVVHLMVISGAHLSLVILAVIGLVRLFTRVFPRILNHIPVLVLASVIGLAIGLLYAILSGFGVPVQRAWLMCLLGRAHYFIPFRFNFWQTWRWSFMMVLILEPHALFYPGTHLSFLAVAILNYVEGLPWSRFKTLGSQLALSFGMGPLTILWFHNLAIIGIFVNILAIPWVAYVVLPYAFMLCLALFYGGPAYLFQGFELVTQGLHLGLEFLNRGAVFNFSGLQSTTQEAILCLMFITFICWLPSRRHFLMASFILSLVIYPHAKILAIGEFWLDVLDVGQGLAIMVRTRHHHLLYDTAGMRGKTSVADRVILPYLEAQRIKKIDKIIISHPDLDHKAGLPLLQQRFPGARLIVDEPKLYTKAQSCFHYRDWSWDGVNFHFIRYRLKSKRSKNNHSCVLLIRNQTQEVMLTGDIEKPAEGAIANIYRKNSLNHFLLVPHHGSLSSSTEKFLKRLKPKLAIMSLGLNNPYHHPHPKVVARYQRFKIPLLSTAELGMIRLILKNRSWEYLTWR